MFKDLPDEENHKKTRMIVESELRAAIRILAYLIEQAGGEITIPHSVLGVDRRVSVRSSALDRQIHLSCYRGDGRDKK